MSLRLVSDVGLHVDPNTLRLTEKEAQIRHMVLWASLVHDMYAVFPSWCQTSLLII